MDKNEPIIIDGDSRQNDQYRNMKMVTDLKKMVSEKMKKQNNLKRPSAFLKTHILLCQSLKISSTECFFLSSSTRPSAFIKHNLLCQILKILPVAWFFLALTGELWTALSQRDEETAQAAWSFCLEELQIVLLRDFQRNYFVQKNYF